MPFVTHCKSCDTVVYCITDRCSYCGSPHVDTKFINSELITRKSGRDILVSVKKDKYGNSKTRPSS